jgi:hypothetical protein
MPAVPAYPLTLRERALDRQLHHYIRDIDAPLERLAAAAG